MSGQGPSELPEAPGTPERPRIGVDEWVGQAEARRQRRSPLRTWVERLPPPARLALFLAAAAVLPLTTSDGYYLRVGVDTLVYMLLALGLNLVVGFAGLLDLGYIAFFGFGAYAYAMLASPHFGIHWPLWAALPVVVAASALLGLLVGLPSRRLVGDYLAIVTLFFGQLFVTVATNGSRMSLLGFTETHNVTGGPNGLADLDPFRFFGHEVTSVKGYFWIALAMLALVVGALYFLSESRTGRAWKALREDPLAAELMGMPVNRLKLLAFVIGAATAGLTGTVFAALNQGVFPDDFSFTVALPLLILVYAIVILGGAGSLTGVVLGAVVINVSLEVLRPPNKAINHPREFFYALVAAGVLAKLRPWRWLGIVVAGTIGLGLVARAVADAVWERGTQAQPLEAGWLRWPLDHWMLLPASPDQIGNAAFAALVGALIVLISLRGRVRKLALVPVLYLAAFVWENRLMAEVSVARVLMLGALLIVLMNARPQGLLGTARVEIA